MMLNDVFVLCLRVLDGELWTSSEHAHQEVDVELGFLLHVTAPKPRFLKCVSSLEHESSQLLPVLNFCVLHQGMFLWFIFNDQQRPLRCLIASVSEEGNQLLLDLQDLTNLA